MSLHVAIQLAARLLTPPRGTVVSPRPPDRGPFLRELVARHCRTTRSVRFYAEALGVSVPHLNRIAVANAGASVRELILRQLAEEAKRDLLLSRARIQEIGFALGFADPAYFSRFFLQRTGTTPSSFRSAHLEKTPFPRMQG